MWMVGCSVIVNSDLPKDFLECCETQPSKICLLIFLIDEICFYSKSCKVGAEIAVKN